MRNGSESRQKGSMTTQIDLATVSRSTTQNHNVSLHFIITYDRLERSISFYRIYSILKFYLTMQTFHNYLCKFSDSPASKRSGLNVFFSAFIQFQIQNNLSYSSHKVCEHLDIFFWCSFSSFFFCLSFFFT